MRATVVIAIMLSIRSVFPRHAENFLSFRSDSRCGSSQRPGRVIGGEKTEAGEFPWIASIQSPKGHFCAGFVISDRFVISAAHCFSKRYGHIHYDNGAANLESLRVAINLVELSDKSVKLFEVKNLILHSDFEEKSLHNDIAILELRTKTDSHLSNPICLPEVHNGEAQSGDVTVAGWGYRDCDSLTVSDDLHQITVPLWSAEDCKDTYNSAGYNFTRKDHVCAGSDGKDTTKGDSGGPLMFLNSKNRWTAIGIVSSGRFMCSDLVPGVYTNIYKYLQWIWKQIGLEK